MLEFPWGDGSLRLDLPSSWRLVQTLTPNALQPEADPEALCRWSLANPIGAPPLTAKDLKGKRVLVVVDDQSRPTPVHHFFRVVRNAIMEAGAAPSDIEVLFALGVHRPMTAAQAVAKIGRENLKRHRWHNHDASDKSRLVSLGRTSGGTDVMLNRLLTEFDLIIPLGVIEPHLLLGFSGGYKMLLPGCAGSITIGQNHLRGFSGPRFNYVGVAADASPMRCDLEEGCLLLRKDVFVVNAVLGPEGQVVAFFSGTAREAFRAGADFVRSYAEARIPEPADVVFTNSRPFDADLRQGMKCIGNSMYAVRPGGLVLGLLYCRQGLGDLRPPRWTLPYPMLRTLLRALGHSALRRVSDQLMRGSPVEDRFLTHFGLAMLHRNDLWVFSEHLPAGTGRKLGVIRQFSSLDAMLDAAVRRVGPAARVIAVPYGGMTYVPEVRDGP